MKLVLLPEAEAEATQAAVWYDGEQAGLGSEFLRELQAALQSILDSPFGQPLLESSETTEPAIRRTLLKRFPYLVIFTIRDEEIFVAAVAHAHRKPGYWTDRMS
jgi:plasmid stabilization system protein ParE